jgi:EAL domain-containing protein (putative c-di-GMP-specific phosphodiesterase class I)
MRTSPLVASAVIAVLLAASWAIGYGVGGAGVAAPHWFYVPIAMAASRFGYSGAAITALVGAVVSGPLLPLDVAAGLPQTPVDWVTRGSFFVGLGQFLAWLIARHDRAKRDLQASTRTVSVLEGLLERQNGDRTALRSGAQGLRQILASGGPKMVFQPIVDLKDGRVQGVEALARFNMEPQRGPDFWFDLAWKTGLGLELELAAARAALREAAFLPGMVYVSVNLSPEVIASEEFREFLRYVPRDGLMVEVTEHAPVEDYKVLVEPVRELRRRGGRLAVDDVGAGFASLRHILRLDPDVIKIDVELTRGIDADRRRRALASGLVSFGAELGCLVISEGIETRDEFDVLRSLGVLLGQGYFLSRPAPPREIDLSRPGQILESAGLEISR